jgi:triosephosphate isomerase
MESGRKVMIGGNWKCNGDQSFIRDIIINMMNTLEYSTQDIEVFFAPASIHLSLCKSLVNEHFGKICAQDISKFECGAYTGEISAEQIKDFDIDLVILGHSERRINFNETSEDVAEKCALAIKYGIRPIICVGETLAQRDEDELPDVITAQLTPIKAKIEDWSKIILVYEPIWTVKTGKIATPEQIQESHLIVRKWVKKNISEEIASAIQILYGGSITEKNCDDVIAMPDIDGFLIGSTSIKKGFRFVVEQISDYLEDKKEES